MQPLTEQQIRASFVNASLRERNSVTMPDLAALDWDQLDFLGWRDRKIDNAGYVVAWVDGAPVGIMMRTGNGRTRTRPQCSWCEDIHLPNEVVMFSAKRAGQAGRNGNTVGILACAGFECSANVRKRPSLAYVGFDVDAAREERIETLRDNITRFVAAVSASSV
ncbi:MAG: FBP domain-containing protein [Microbacteriaceae bacterium]|nr:FBP domain-containing protein [Microbacteriaceae bacterium]MCL2793829.1 FBP domain-containing protein [Microbacteriaceae bacterium]